MCMQYMRTGRNGVTAFRRLIGQPILKDILLQDVVFSDGREEYLDSQATAYRSSVTRLKDLNRAVKKLERQDLQSVWKDSVRNNRVSVYMEKPNVFGAVT